MTDLSPASAILLVLWGTVVGLDLVSVPQAMLARPVVAGAVAGWLAGDLEAGLRVGVLFELFALDVLPVGAVRYPDYGPATVAATALAADSSWELALGVSTALGLVIAVLGGFALQQVRRANARAIQHRSAALAAGQSGAIRLLQYGSLARDAARSAGLTALGLACAWALAEPVADLDPSTALGLTLVALGCALSAVIGGALRNAGRGPRLRWLGAGALVGLIAAALR
ncbi:MAG TPA: PTS sugar transporter subunit IIC [Gemmatimonadales bacterium]|jgi:PTS system mannose-specific IIC component|nr:PTS sugar transporter subunit IIC [Gemmatimonadales bacterium]